MKKKYFSLFSWYAFILFGQILSGLLTKREVTNWYDELSRPAWTAPNWIFGPVWALLYATMAFAVWLVWENRSNLYIRGRAIFWFCFQLLCNFAWTPLFFTLHRIDLAAYCLVLLLIGLSFTIYWFLKSNLLAGWLLVPYMIWCVYAFCLNLVLLWMN